MDPEARVIGGKYRLTRKLGQGGMGSVWRAEHLTLRSPVALKLLEGALASDRDGLGRFFREAQAAAALRSPHVVQILDHGVDSGVPYIVMELLEGESLAERLRRVGRLSLAETSHIVTHVSRAIGRAHEAGVVHRDLKPDNIFLVRNDEEDLAKVLDFGIAKSMPGGLASSAAGETRTGAFLGTPYYMSPEQAEGSKTLDHRTDIWSLGVIACECLVGRRPFEAETLGSLVLSICSREMPVPSRLGPVPEGFDGWFARACSRDIAARFSTAKEAAAALKRLGEGATQVSVVAANHPLAASNQEHLVTLEGASPALSLSGLSATGVGAKFRPRRRLLGVAVVVGVLVSAGVMVWALPHPGDTKPLASADTPTAHPAAQPPALPAPEHHEPAASPAPEQMPASSARTPEPAATPAISARATAHAKPSARPAKPPVAAGSRSAPASEPRPEKPRINLGI